MSRTARASVGGICYHVINRGNARATVFFESADYRAFLNLMRVACERIRMRLLAYCLMPNHFHLVLYPHEDGDLSRWLHWLLTAHVKRHHRIKKTTGRIWQGRFKAFPVEQDKHLLTVMRYVERNPVRANLVSSAADWDWSSLSFRNASVADSLLSVSPVTRPQNWQEIVDTPQSSAELEALRRCRHKNTPYGSDAWVDAAVASMGLESSMRGPGRPKSGHS